MFGKFAAGLKRAGKGSHGQRYKIDIKVIQLEALPSAVRKCKVVWSRSSKIQATETRDVRKGVASFNQLLSLVTTIYRDKTGKAEEKEYEFKVQVPGMTSTDQLLTIGKAHLDMAKFCTDETRTQNQGLPITFKAAGNTTGFLKMEITTIFLGDAGEDGMTEVSGITGLTSDHGSVREQDLEGFHEDDHSKLTKKASKGRSSKADDAGPSSGGASRLRPGKKGLPPTVEEGDDPDEDEQPAAAKPKPKKAPAPPANNFGDEEDNPFAKKVAPSKPPARKPPPAKVWADEEDVSPVSSDLEDERQIRKGPSKPKEPEEDLDDMKASLFSVKKGGSSSAGPSASKAAAAPPPPAATAKGPKKAPPPPPAEEDEDEGRNYLFTVKPKVAPPPPAAAAEEDEDELRSDLFLVKKKGAPAKPASAPATKGQRKPAAIEEESGGSEEDGPSTSAPKPPPKAPAAAPRTKSGDAPPAPPSSSRSGNLAKSDSKGGAADVDLLRQRVAQLEEELAAEMAAKNDMSKKLQQYKDTIADLEDQVAEGDTGLYNQMKDMEARYQVEIKELMDKHLAEVDEAEERHREEIRGLQEQIDDGGGAGAGPRAADLEAREAALATRAAKLEAQQAAATRAQAAAEAKLAEANKMIDDSLLVATRHQQENKALQDEIARLKQQVSDASSWNIHEAVAAATSNHANGEELEELREKIQELQEENAKLQAVNDEAERAAAAMLEEVEELLGALKGASHLQNGVSSLTVLSTGVRTLCGMHRQQTHELNNLNARLQGLQSGAPAARAAEDSKVRPHELLSRVHLLASERDQLLDKLQHREAAAAELASDLAAAQQRATALQTTVAELQQERAAMEQLKRSTIQDLRRQNAELRSNLRSMSPSPPGRATRSSANSVAGDNSPVGAPSTPMGAGGRNSGSGEGNWQEFETLVAQLTSDRADLRDQVRQLNQTKADLEARLAELAAQASRQRDVLAEREEQLIDLQDQHRRLQEERRTLQPQGSLPRSSPASGDAAAVVQQLEAENASLRAQVAELQEAETVIKEWSDYADTLAADKQRLEEQVKVLSAQLAAAAATAAAPAPAAAQLPQQDKRPGSAGAGGAATAPSALSSPNAAAAVAGLAPAELRQQIQKLEASVTGLRQQLSEVHSRGNSRATSVGGMDDTASSRFFQQQRGQVADTDDGSDVAEADVPGPAWEGRLEQLSARNAALEATVSGLRSSLVTATRSLEGKARADELAALQLQLAQTLESQAQLQAKLLVMQSDLEQSPLLGRSDATAYVSRSASQGMNGVQPAFAAPPLALAQPPQLNAAGSFGSRKVVSPGEHLQQLAATTLELQSMHAEVTQLRQERQQLAGTVDELRLEVQQLQEDKADVEARMEQVSAEMQEVAEALDAAGLENERLSAEVFTLRASLDELEEAASAVQRSAPAAAPPSRSGSMQRGGAIAASTAPSTASTEAALHSLERQLLSAKAAAQELLDVMHDADDDSDGEAPQLTRASDIPQALHAVKGHMRLLQRQVALQAGTSAATAVTTTTPSPQQPQQLTDALNRIQELEVLLEDAEIENQHLTEELEGYLTGGGVANSVGSVAEESQSPYSGGAAIGHPGAAAANPFSYGHDATLTLSALGQRLSLAESRRDEVSTALEESSRTARRLAAELRQAQDSLEAAQQANTQLQADAAAAVQRLAEVCEVDPVAILGADLAAKVSSSRGGVRGAASGESDEDPGDRRAIKDKAQLQRELNKSLRTAADLQASNQKLEGILEDLEQKASQQEEELEKLQDELQATKELLHQATERSQALQRRLEEEVGGFNAGAAAAGGAGAAQLRGKVSELEAKAAKLAKEKASLEEQLADEREAREELEYNMRDKLERSGDDEAAETVAAFEAKYNRLKDRYKALEESSQEVIEELQDQLAEAQEKIADLQRQVKQLQANQGGAAARAGSATASGSGSKELEALRRENETLVQQLVGKTMELAQLSETEITLRREITRAKEVNMKLALKMTSLEAQAYANQSAQEAAKDPKAKK